MPTSAATQLATLTSPTIPVARRISPTPSPNFASSAAPITAFPSSVRPPTGITTLNSLRSLLPFAPNKQPTPISPALSPSSNPHRTTFVSFGSVRKSLQRERVSSSADLPSNILHNQTPKLSSETVLRRSISCSNFDKPLPGEPDVAEEWSSRSLIEDSTNLDGAPLQPSPSPEPLIPNDLSTILEADTSGLSKQTPSIRSPSHSSSSARNSLSDNCILIPSNKYLAGDPAEQDDSFLDLPATGFPNKVMDAAPVVEDTTALQSLARHTAVVIDTSDADDSELDPDLATLLSPNSLTPSANNQSKPPPRPRFSPLSSSVTAATELKATPPSRLPRLHSSMRTSHSPATSPSPSATSHIFIAAPGSTPSPTAVSFSSRPYTSKVPTRPSPSVSRSNQFISTTPLASPSTMAEPGAAFTTPSAALAARWKGSVSTSTLDLPSASHPERARGSTSLDLPRQSSQPHPAPKDQTYAMPHRGVHEYRSNSDSRLSVADSRPDLTSDSNEALELSDTVRSQSGVSSSSAFLARRAELQASTRRRSMSVREHEHTGRKLAGRTTGSGSRYHRQDHEQAALDVGEFGEMPERSASSLSGRVMMTGGRAGPPAAEWLGPRSLKAFRDAGLVSTDGDRDRDDGGDTGVGTRSMGRASAIVRSSSEYSSRVPSRMEAGNMGPNRRRADSSTGVGRPGFSALESPTYTGSSPGGGSRDHTPRSGSTAPTSVSASASSFAFGLREREREWERDEMRELRERHATETGALLGALSDSQGMTRMLRRENEELRVRVEKLESMHTENDKLRRMTREMRNKMEELRGQRVHRGIRPPVGHAGRAFGAWNIPPRRSSLSRTVLYGRGEVEDAYSDEAGEELDLDHEVDETAEPPQDRAPQPEDHDEDDTLQGDLVNPISSSTPAKAHRRRLSTASSVMPALPANMTMLLHDHGYDDDIAPFGANFTADFDSFRAPAPREMPAATGRGYEHSAKPSLGSNMSHTTTTDISMTSTASAQSFFLRPEHEVYLDDLKSLDLGHR